MKMVCKVPLQAAVDWYREVDMAEVIGWGGRPAHREKAAMNGAQFLIPCPPAPGSTGVRATWRLQQP